MEIATESKPSLTIPGEYAVAHGLSFNGGVRSALREGMEQRYGVPYEWVRPSFDLAEPWVLRPVTLDETAP